VGCVSSGGAPHPNLTEERTKYRGQVGRGDVAPQLRVAAAIDLAHAAGAQPNLYHGWRVIGTEEAFIVNMPTSPYDYSEPDALDLPYDSPAAQEVVPWRW